MLSPETHILDINGVWYSLFWSERPKNHLNSTNVGDRIFCGTIPLSCFENFFGKVKAQEIIQRYIYPSENGEGFGRIPLAVKVDADDISPRIRSAVMISFGFVLPLFCED